MPSWVLKFPRADSSEGPILVHVSQKDNGHALDLDLLATDGDSAYRTKVRERNLKKHQADNFDGSDEEWLQILHYALVSKLNSGIADSVRKNLEIHSVVSGKRSKAILSITFRTKVEDITHKLGSVDLAYSEDTDDVDLFGWACQAIEQRDGFAQKVEEEQTKSGELKSEVTRLTSELHKFMAAKLEHDEQIVSKFALVLNAKKSYIRQQQAALANTDAPPVVPSTTTSRSRKRKQENTEPDADDESDDFENMQVDQENQGSDDDEERTISRQSTPPRRESTSSEDQPDLDTLPQTKGKQVTRASAQGEASKTPPPRSLPFGAGKKGKPARNQQSSASSAQPKNIQKIEAEDDDETASEADEL